MNVTCRRPCQHFERYRRMLHLIHLRIFQPIFQESELRSFIGRLWRRRVPHRLYLHARLEHTVSRIVRLTTMNFRLHFFALRL